MVSTTLEVVGALLIAIGAFLVSIPLGLAALGCLALLAGIQGDE